MQLLTQALLHISKTYQITTAVSDVQGKSGKVTQSFQWHVFVPVGFENLRSETYPRNFLKGQFSLKSKQLVFKMPKKKKKGAQSIPFIFTSLSFCVPVESQRHEAKHQMSPWGHKRSGIDDHIDDRRMTLIKTSS